MENLQICFSTGPNCKASGRNAELPLDNFLALLTTRTIRPTKDGPWHSDAVLRDDTPTPSGKNLTSANVAGVGRALTFDLDEIAAGEWEAMRQRVRANGWRYAAYTTNSCRPDLLKLHVVLLTDRNLVIGADGVTLEMIGTIKAAINRDVFDGKADPASHKPAQLYYLPSHDGSPEALVAGIEETDGVGFLDLTGYIAEAAASSRPKPDASSRVEPEEGETKHVARIREALRNICADDYDTYFRVGTALKNEFGEEGYKIWREWSMTSAKFEENENVRQWAALSDDSTITIATVFALAKADNTFTRAAAGAGKGSREDRKSNGTKPTFKVETMFSAAANMEEKALSWLIPNWIPRNAVSLAFGKTKIGKSQFAIRLAALVSTGTPFRPGDPMREPAGVALITGEDDHCTIVIPRLKVAGADLSKIAIVHGCKITHADGQVVEHRFALSESVEQLRSLLVQRPDIRLVIVDPINAYLGGKVDAHRNNEVRAVLQPLKTLAETFNVSVLLVHHSKKGSVGDNDLADMAGGSAAFGEFARSIIMLARHGEEDNRFVVQLLTATSARGGEGLVYTIEEARTDKGNLSQRFVILEGEKAPPIGEALRDKDGEEAGALDDAKQFLAGELGDGKEHPSNEIKDAAKAEGLSWSGAVRRAAKVLGVRIEKKGFNPARWFWSLPPAKASQAFREAAVSKATDILNGTTH